MTILPHIPPGVYAGIWSGHRIEIPGHGFIVTRDGLRTSSVPCEVHISEDHSARAYLDFDNSSIHLSRSEPATTPRPPKRIGVSHIRFTAYLVRGEWYDADGNRCVQTC